MKLYLLLPILVLLSCNKDRPISEERSDIGSVLDISLSGSLQNPAFSPDGESIVFTRFLNGYNKEPAEIYTYHISTKQLNLLVSDGSGNINLPGSVWRNGQIVFASTRDPHDEIYVISEVGSPGDEVRISSRSNMVAYEPSFNPDGDWVVFESHVLDVETEGVIVKYKVDGSSSYIALSDLGNDCRQPNWSPAGDKILYQKLENGQWNIWTVEPDGTNHVQVTSNTGNCTDASFSDDGQLIVFSSDFGVDIANIFQVSIIGENLEKLTDFAGYDGAVSISPNGNRLVFESVNADPDNSSGTHIILLEL